MLDLKDIETPFFLFDKNVLLKEIQKIKVASSRYWPNTIVAYSVKTNSLPYLAHVMNTQDVWVE